MKYTELGNTGLRVSRFGLGCMRLPGDESEAIEMIRYALDNGVNYLDTAYAYGDSETIVGKALKDGYREKAIIATKNPVWEINSYDDFEKILDKELKALGVEQIDMYLLHDLNMKHWEFVKKYDGLTFLDKMKRKGKIGHKACSFHGPYEHFKNVLNYYDWEMIQIQLGILDENSQAGVKGLKDAYAKNLPVVIMEPLRGGGLLKYRTKKVNQLIESFSQQRSLAEWAFRWLYNMPEVGVVLSGTNELWQLKENIDIFNRSETNVMTKEEKVLIDKIKKAFKERYEIPCTGCEYCMPCPYNVNIPEIFNYYNVKKMTHHWVDTLLYRRNNIKNGTDASQCVECMQCIEKCPQGINIPEMLKKADAELR